MLTLTSLRKTLHDLSGLKRLWPYLRAEKKYVFIAAGLIPVISLLSMSMPIVLKKTIDQGISANNLQFLAWGSTAYLLLVILDYFMRAAQTLVSARAVHRMIRSMRSYLMTHILGLSARYHDKNMSGALVTRATSDFDDLSESLNQGVLTSIVDLFVLLGALAGVFILDWRLALITLALFPLVSIAVIQFSRALKRAMMKARVKIASLNAFSQECIYGQSTVKLLSAEKAANDRYKHMAGEFRDAQMESVVLDASMFAVLDGIASISIGIVLYWATRLAVGEAVFSPGLLVAFVAYLMNLFEPIKQLGNKMAMMQGAFTAIDRVFGVLDVKDFIGGEKPVEQLDGELRFDHVSFKYGKDSSAPLILKDVSFHLPAGHSVAIVGPTGSGKSTIVKLVTKLYDGYTGHIFLDDHDTRLLDGPTLRQHIAIVPQDIVLFTGSISFNISLGMPGITHDDIVDAAKTVGAHAFIESLPGGYDFVVAEQGKNLSYGQSQLLAFARALARKPTMIVLDEATSSVDPQAEAMIQEGIRRLLKGRSVIVIAHRLSTIQQCDEILLLRHGEIIERGRHEDLIKQRGAYYRLATSMREGFETPSYSHLEQ